VELRDVILATFPTDFYLLAGKEAGLYMLFKK